MAETSMHPDVFDGVFTRFETDKAGYINTKDFLNIIDELDALQSEDAEPIITEDQREEALKVVDAAIPMSKQEVLDFLEELGVEFTSDHHSVASESPEVLWNVLPIGNKGELQSEQVGSATSARKNDLAHGADQVVATNGSAYDHSSELERQTPVRSLVTRNTHRTAPLAQSTPRKDFFHPAPDCGKENRRPKSSTAQPLATSLFSALGEGTCAPSGSPRTTDDPQYNAPEVFHLQDMISSLRERERVNERSIAASEHHINRLEKSLEQSKAEFLKSQKALSDLRNTYGAAEHSIRELEREVETTSRELSTWQQKHKSAKSEIETISNEAERLRGQLRDRDQHVDEVRLKLTQFDDERREWFDEKQSFVAQISGLEIQCEKLTYTEAQLAEALSACTEWEQQVEQLQADMDQIKKASVRSSGLRIDADTGGKVTPTLGPAKSTQYPAQAAPAQPSIDEIPSAPDRFESNVRQTTSTAPDMSQDALIQQHYTTLSNELGLQRNLIDTMLRMKPNIRKTKSRTRSSPPTQLASSENKRAVLDWIRVASIFALYSLVLLVLGHMIASQAGTTSTSGVSYAERKAWGRANSIEYLLDHHGVLGSGGSYRWWEGGWVWVEKLGYWLEEMLQDESWPS